MRDEGDVSDELGRIFFHVQTSGEMGCFQRADYTLIIAREEIREQRAGEGG